MINEPITYECDSGAEIVFTETDSLKYPVRITITANTTGSASLTNHDMDALAFIFRKGGPWYI